MVNLMKTNIEKKNTIYVLHVDEEFRLTEYKALVDL